jgi:hypothetical protein
VREEVKTFDLHVKERWRSLHVEHVVRYRKEPCPGEDARLLGKMEMDRTFLPVPPLAPYTRGNLGME